jgi:hypothetical protein
MRKIQIILTFSIVTLVISCKSNSSPDILRPNWQGIKTSGLVFDIGDLISIRDSNFYYAAMLLDLDSDSSGIWYGFCLTNFRDTIKPDLEKLDSLYLFGRQIPSGLINTQCIDCYDLTYINENGLILDRDKFSLIEHINYNPLKIFIGSNSPTMELSGLVRDYQRGIEKRKKEPDDCKTSIFKLDAVRERFFPFTMIK